MEVSKYFGAVRSVCNAGRATVTLAVLLGAGTLAAVPAAAYPEYVYKATAAGHPNITMNLTITDVKGINVATGSIYLGNILFTVSGDLAGSALNAGATIYRPGVAVLSTPVPVIGTLKGALGTGAIDVMTGYLDFNGGYLELSFALEPVPPPAPAPKPAPPVLPDSVHMTGSTGFGYTVVTLRLDLSLKGTAYDVSGTLSVSQQVGKTDSVSTFPVSAVLTPGVEGKLTVTGAPAGDSPDFNGTIGATGTTFTSLLTGLPTLGITGLYINAEQ